MQMNSFSHSYGQSLYHIVLVPYKRRKIFGVPGFKERIKKIFREISQKYKLKFYALKVKRNHVHILTNLPPTLSLSKLFQILKGLSSYLFFKDKHRMREHWGKLWSRGKSFRSISSVTAGAVKNYIENQ